MAKKNTISVKTLSKIIGEGLTIGIEKTEGPQEADLNNLLDFGATLLMFATEVHIWHLNCERNSIHVALQDLYETTTDIADKLLEAVMGITGSKLENKPENQDYVFGNLIYSEACIDRIRQMEATAEVLIPTGFSGVDNILADFCEKCDEVVYKLKQLA